MDSRRGSFPNIIKSLTDATNEFGDGVRLTTGPRSRDPRGLHLGRPAFYRFRVVARERSGAGRFSLWRFCGPRCMIIPWAWSATAPRTRTIVSGARRIGLGRSIMAPRACKCKPAVRRICHGLNLSSRPSGPSADGTMPVRSHRENAVRLLVPDVWTMPSPAYCCGENIRATLSYKSSAREQILKFALLNRASVVWCRLQDSNL